MMKGRILLITLAVLCSTYAFAASMPGAAVSTSGPSLGTVVHNVGSYGSHCDGDFGAGTGVCILLEDFTAPDTGPLADVTGNPIVISPNNDIVTGTVGIFEPDGVTLSDVLIFNFTQGIGTTVQLTSDPNNFFTSNFDGLTNEAPCALGSTEGCVALWSVGNQYLVISDLPEPSTIMLLGSGLVGAYCFVRRRLM